ncbi:MAG: V-type ATP synthase subunit E family protein [Promethearchaeati archaeon SRVP18_Atabeyarchaeia-1]
MSKAEATESMEKRIEEIEVTGEPERIKKIEKKIMDEAEDKAKLILKEADKSKKETIEELRREGEREAEKIARSGSEEADSLKMQKVAEARLKAKQMIIASKEQLINETMDKARQKLIELTASKGYEKILQKLIEEGGIGLGGGELEIVLAGKGTKTNLDLNSISSNIEKETGRKTTVKLSQEKSKSIGGVVVRKTDATIMIDNTFEARIDRAIREIRIRVAKLLFD